MAFAFGVVAAIVPQKKSLASPVKLKKMEREKEQRKKAISPGRDDGSPETGCRIASRRLPSRTGQPIWRERGGDSQGGQVPGGQL